MIKTAAVRGTGSIGARHLRVLRSFGVGELIAVPVRPGRTSSPELADARIADSLPHDADLIVVATDTARHIDDALEALETGARLVLVEKPLAQGTAEINALQAHPRCDRVRVCAPLRFHESLRAARAAIEQLDDGQAATGRSVRIVSQSWLPSWRPNRDYRDSYSARPGQGGVLLDLVHEIDYALWTFGEPAGSVAAALSTLPSPVLGLAVEEAADLIWATADDTHVSIRLDYVTRPPRRSMEVTSAHGEIVWDALDSRVQITTPEGERLSTRYGDDLDRDAVLLRQVRALDSVLQGGEENGLLDLKTARLAVEITERARAITRRELDDNHPEGPEV